MRPILQLLALVFTLMTTATALAQDFGVIAQVDPQESEIKDGWFGTTTLHLHLSQGVPFRVFHLAKPPRLVIDFKEVDWRGVRKQDLLKTKGRVQDLRFGAIRAGWSRLVLELGEPMLPAEIGMPVDHKTGRARLNVVLEKADEAAFTRNAGMPANSDWSPDAPPRRAGQTQDDDFIVMIDPGHGGIDPGAVHEGVTEKDLVLTLARGLAEALLRSGRAKAMLTRNEDVFVSLPARVAKAHQAKADLFISLHADALDNGQARGATIYTLSRKASDAIARQLAIQQDRADIIAGIDLTDSDDQVSNILIDLARQETDPRSEAFAQSLIRQIEAANLPLSKKRRNFAGFSVLKSPDIPSVLIEIGFLSNPRDRTNLRDPVWRNVMISALMEAIFAWRKEDQATRLLLRQ